jgi:hypothetical protein
MNASGGAGALAQNPAAFDTLLRVVQELTLVARRAPEEFQNVFTTRGPQAVSGQDLALAIEETRKLPLPHPPTAEDRVRIGAVAKLFFDNKTIDRPLAVDQIVLDLAEAVRAQRPTLAARLSAPPDEQPASSPPSGSPTRAAASPR